MTIKTYKVKNTRRAALAFGAILAADLGYTNDVVRIKGGHRCEASDGKAVDFIAKK